VAARRGRPPVDARRRLCAGFRQCVLFVEVYSVDCVLWLGVWVTVGTPGRTERSSIRLLGQNCKPYMVLIRCSIICFNTFLLSTQQWHLALDDRPCAQHVQSTRRMSLTVKRPSSKCYHFCCVEVTESSESSAYASSY
jgi:hypothetical protein